jgi:hypothetical protein
LVAVVVEDITDVVALVVEDFTDVVTVVVYAVIGVERWWCRILLSW